MCIYMYVYVDVCVYICVLCIYMCVLCIYGVGYVYACVYLGFEYVYIHYTNIIYSLNLTLIHNNTQ